MAARFARVPPPSALFGLLVVLSYALLALLTPVLAPFGEREVVGSAYQPWTAQHLLGTDALGRDMLTRLLYGGRNTLGIALIATCLTFLIGAWFGLLAAVGHRLVGEFLGRVVDIMMSVPQLILKLFILSLLGTSIPVLIVVIAFVDSTRVFRLTRATAQSVAAMDFVEAARVRGEGLLRIMWREILPNIAAPLLAEFGLRFCFVFLAISSLSFLGVGLQPPLADWGSMVRENAALITFGDITPLVPAGAIALLTVSVNFIVDWLLHLSSGLTE